MLGIAVGLIDRDGGLARAFRRRADDLRQLAKGARAFLQRCGLLLGAAREVVRRGRKVARTAGDFVGHRADVDQRRAQRVHRIVIGAGHDDVIFGKIFRHALFQIAVGKLGQHVRQRGKRFHLIGLDAGALLAAAAFLFGRERAGGFRLLPQPDIFDRIVTEDGNRAHHVANFVAAVAAFDGNFKIAIGEPCHRFGHALQRAAQRFDQHQAADDGKQRAGNHGDDRDIGGTLAVLLAGLLGAAHEILEGLTGIGHQRCGVSFCRLPAGADIDQLGRPSIDLRQ